MKSSFKQKRHLFTLLEVLVSMGVFTILMLALMQFFSAAQTVWERSGNRTETYESARLAIQMLKQDLSTAFYGDPEHDMDDSTLQLRFFSCEKVGKNIHLTFVSEKDKSLTEVDYCWMPEDDGADTNCTFSIATLEAKENPSGNIDIDSSTSKWVTKKGDWISEVRQADRQILLTNVFYFNVKRSLWTEAGTLPDPTDCDGSAKRPPALLYIRMGVVSDNAIERIGRLSNKTTRKDILTQVRTIFTAVFGNDGTFQTGSLDDDRPDLAQRKILFDGTQFFNVLVHIER